MNIKETLEQCLFAWNEVKYALIRMNNTAISADNIYLQALADQEIDALEHDLQELEGEKNEQ